MLGWFITLVEQECEDPVWRKLGVVTNARLKRMKDAQFMSELLLMIIEKKQHGFDQDMLDAAYGGYDDLEEADVEVNPDEVKETLVAARDFLAAAQDSNGSIKDHVATFGAFYTVWALVVLHRAELPDAPGFAARLKDFMEKVRVLDTSDNKAALLTGEGGAALKRPMEFLEAYRGASTDLAPRTKRLEALRLFFLNV
jgi:predicted CopG family antitoxin